MINSAMFSSATEEWATPQAFFDELDKEFSFTLDPCATPENAKCKRFITKDADGLAQSWRGETVFCNPPYGRSIYKWVKKAHDEVIAGGANNGCYAYPRKNRHAIFSRLYLRAARGTVCAWAFAFQRGKMRRTVPVNGSCYARRR